MYVRPPDYRNWTHLFIQILFNVIVLQAIDGRVPPKLLELLLDGEVDTLVVVEDDLFLVRLSYDPQDLLVQLL